jgi:acyl carrier protein
METNNNGQAAEAIEAWMVLRLSDELKLDPSELDTSLPIVSYGLDSIVAFTLTGELSDWLMRDIPYTLFWEYPTVEALAGYLAGEVAPEESDRLYDSVKRALEEVRALSDESQPSAASEKASKR